MDNTLQTKDLINVGLFTAIYFVVFFVVAMVGYIPVMLLVIPFLCPLAAGIPFMLFLTQVQKFGMVTIMGTILGLLMFILGHPWPCIPLGIICALLGDFILKGGRYRNWTSIRMGYVVFSEWLMGLMFPLFFMRESYFATIRDGYGDAYADSLMAITPTWFFGFFVLIIALGALAGAYLGRAALKKHFERAGIA